MKKNINIKKAIKKFELVLIFLIIIQVISFFIFRSIFFNNIEMFSDIPIDFNTLKIIITSVFIVICIIVDIIYMYQHIYKRKSLINSEARECIIEDFIITYYVNSSSDNIDYQIEPVIRDIKTNKIYFTYSDYNLSYYNSVESRSGKSIVNKQIYRKDKSFVNVGDKAYFYIRKILDVNVDIDSNKNVIYLKTKNSKSKMRYKHVNQKYNINDVKDFIFFEGIVEVEDINNN